MPKRSSFTDRLDQQQEAPQGREAIYAQRRVGSGRGGPGGWEARHHRVIFYCPMALLAELQEEVGRSGRSKSQVLVDALRAELERARADRVGY